MPLCRLLPLGSLLVARLAIPTPCRRLCRPNPCRRRLSHYNLRCLRRHPFRRRRWQRRCRPPHHLMPSRHLTSLDSPLVARLPAQTPYRRLSRSSPRRLRLNRRYRRRCCRHPFRRPHLSPRCRPLHRPILSRHLLSLGSPLAAQLLVPTPCRRPSRPRP
jgi:hypothetical protein